MDTEAALDMLLRDRALRRAFRDGCELPLDLDDAARDALALITPAEIDDIAALMRREVFGRGFVGVGTLLDAFPQTLAAYRAAHPADTELDELAGALIESTFYATYGDIGTRVSLEEVFYRFALSVELADPNTLEDEFLATTMRALAAVPSPRYVVPAEVRRRGDAFIVLGRRRGYVLAHGALAMFDLSQVSSRSSRTRRPAR
jgi:hypothetical protein